ncbi:hypothetical protein [Novosphingobium sp. SG707]|uniref:hypothetical protein n=1 Tax=Novosphingobium sp. SG707 TaxID=2586996 RepID=UPI001445F841|nr:hypothetical protein [Novosphingobium sp. SG707]NKJ00253.1 hypothetical protein [Novosphingobium sp. SG707]
MMTGPSDKELGETPARFLSHWIASGFGCILNRLLPLVLEWPAPALNEAFPRWWELIGSAGLISLFTVIFNANLPVTARELMKSASMGFAICATLKIFGVLG